MIILRSQFGSIHSTMDYLIFSFTPQCHAAFRKETPDSLVDR